MRESRTSKNGNSDLMKTDYDVITVGGGLGGAALAKVLAENGKRVLVVERETEFKDRVRGEYLCPWGVAEAQKLGLFEMLMAVCAHEQPFFNIVGMGPPRDLRTTTVPQLPALTLFHPEMQEVVLKAAREAGAEVSRGASVRGLSLGRNAEVSIDGEGAASTRTARLVVCADGRTSNGRAWGGFTTMRARPKSLGAGVLFDNMNVDPKVSVCLINSSLGRVAYLFPQTASQVRAYLMYEPEMARLQGSNDVSRFVVECERTGMPAETYSGARPIGPLASFDMTENWVEHPARAGLALLGDAAGATDPTWGQGLSLTLRDARVLSNNLLETEDWDRAVDAYADAREAYFKRTITVADWWHSFFLTRGEEANRVRERALPLIMQEPDRIPDHFLSGPDLPCDDGVRKRFLGEI